VPSYGDTACKVLLPECAAVQAGTASLAAGLFAAGRERALADHRSNEMRQLANKLFAIEYETRKLPAAPVRT
jgi:hypothetical protein